MPSVHPRVGTVLKRARGPVFAGLVLLVTLLAAWMLAPDAGRRTLRERAFDVLLPYLLPESATIPGVVVVDIDRATLARFGSWPWPRQRMALLVAAVAAGHPAVLAIDILFAGPDRFDPDNDAALARALLMAPSVLGFVLETRTTDEDLPVAPILSPGPVSLPGLWRAKGATGPAEPLVDATQGLGALVAAADHDGPIRRVPLLITTGATVRPSLAIEALRVAQQAHTLLIDREGTLRVGLLSLPLGGDAMLRLSRFSGGSVVPADRLMDDPAIRAALAGRIVLIGSSAPELGGLRVTPASPATPSVQFQAAAIEAILRGQAPVRPAWAEVAEPAGAALLGLCCLLMAAALRPAAATAFALCLCLGWSAAAAAAVPGFGVLLDPAAPPLLAIVAFALAALARFARHEWRARMLRLSFEQHLAPEVVRRIAADPAALRLQGEMREITALFTDIEGFTAMTERAAPTDLIALLDAYFDVAARIVTDHGGMIDKIVGDAIHAIFNAPLALPDHPRRAVESALALVAATEEVRRSPLGQALQIGRTRIGIETGPAIVGDVGGSRKLDYTAHGNAINAAARLEAANKELGSAICIGPGAAAHLDPATIRPIARLSLRGQSGEICVYTPVSLTG